MAKVEGDMSIHKWLMFWIFTACSMFSIRISIRNSHLDPIFWTLSLCCLTCTGIQSQVSGDHYAFMGEWYHRLAFHSPRSALQLSFHSAKQVACGCYGVGGGFYHQEPLLIKNCFSYPCFNFGFVNNFVFFIWGWVESVCVQSFYMDD